MFKQVFAALCIFCISFSTFASLISSNGYTLNESSNIVTGANLEWLQWDVTKGQSVQEALNSNSGWSLATTSDMLSLFSDFGFTFNSSGSENNSTAENFVTLFGNTNSGNKKASNALYNGILDPLLSLGSINQNFEETKTRWKFSFSSGLTRTTTVEQNDAKAWLRPTFFNSRSNYGIALVRDVPVPSPSVLIIFLLGVAGAYAAKKRN